jgi:hypothetical protein
MNYFENPVTDPQLPVATISVSDLEAIRREAAVHAQSFLQDNIIPHGLTTDPLLAVMAFNEVIKQKPTFAEPFIISLALDVTPLVGFHWCVDDVKERRPDLSDEECLEVLARCKHKHDATIGMNWDVIDVWADDLFPAPDDIEDQREADAANPHDFANSRYAGGKEA